MNSRAAAFGERLAKTLGKGPSASSLSAQEAALIAGTYGRRERPTERFSGTTRVALGLAMAAVVMLGLGLGLAAFSADPSPQGVAPAPPLAGAVVRTDGANSKTLAFVGGSTVIVKPGSLIEVERAEPEWTEVGLTRGRLELDIQKRQEAHFAVTAGSYRVVVIGTRFQVAFDDALERLTVSVREGQVRVFGKGLPQEGEPVAAGSRFEHSGKAPRQSDSAPASASMAVSSAQDRGAAGVKRLGAQRAGGSAPPTWQELAKQGRYSDAYSLAEQGGFETVLNSLPAGDLLMLANSARFAGKPTQARRAFLELRERFAGRPEAVLASFYLARIALDSERNTTAAAHWFRTYLRDAPNGQLAAGARVDLMNILLGQGDHAGARRLAEDYLKHHPNGAHAGVARSLLERADPSP